MNHALIWRPSNGARTRKKRSKSREKERKKTSVCQKTEWKEKVRKRETG